MIKINRGDPAPPPDLENKPDDVTQYAFAPVCDLDHVTGFGKTEISIKDLETLTACSTCGRPARYQTILRTAEAKWKEQFNWLSREEIERWDWVILSHGPNFDYLWSKAERVRTLIL